MPSLLDKDVDVAGTLARINGHLLKNRTRHSEPTQ